MIVTEMFNLGFGPYRAMVKALEANSYASDDRTTARDKPSGQNSMSSKQRALSLREAYPPATSYRTWPAREPSRTPVVLIVDEDLGFVWWLGDIFSKAGCQVVPALNCLETVSLTRELNLEVDVIVVNPELAGASETIRTLNRIRPVKVVAIGNHTTDIRGTVHAQATLERPSGWGPVSQQEWLGCVRRVVKQVQATSVACLGYS